MHPKFAKRIAKVIRDKRKAVGAAATTAWWQEVFPRVTKEQLLQVKEELKR